MFSRELQLTIALALGILVGSETVARGEISSTSGLLDMKAATSGKTLVAEFPLGDEHAQRKTYVRIYEENQVPMLSKRDVKRDPQGRIIVDMTPSECTSESCYEGAFQPPDKLDCDAIIEAQLYNSTGSLTARPGTFVYVTTGTCAVVFQNPNSRAEYTLDYNWAKLGLNIQNIQKKCFQPSQKSIGGICGIKHYLNYTLDNVGISLQRLAN